MRPIGNVWFLTYAILEILEVVPNKFENSLSVFDVNPRKIGRTSVISGEILRFRSPDHPVTSDHPIPWYYYLPGKYHD